MEIFWPQNNLPFMGFETVLSVKHIIACRSNSHCALSSNLFHGQIVQIAILQLSGPENKKCSPWKVFGRNHPQTKVIYTKYSKQFSRATFFVFWVTWLKDSYLNNLPVKQIWRKSAVWGSSVWAHFYSPMQIEIKSLNKLYLKVLQIW